MGLRGPKSLLTKELTSNIRKLILEGKKNVEVRKILDINESTWDNWYWDNYEGFRTFINDCIFERRVKKAGYVIEATMDDDDKKLSLDAAKFTAETLGKQHYSKKTETDVTSNGETLGVVILPSKDESTLETTTEAGDSTS